MKIKSAKFITSIAKADKYEEYAASCALPEICVVGRSNVGKSTFINMLAGQKKLAKTSSTPGRTRLVNVFDFGEGIFRLIDLPGYGYALASKEEKSQWGELMEGYLRSSRTLCRTLVLVDSRHEPTLQDEQMVNYLYYYQMPFTVIATKCDKLSKAAVGRAVQTIATKLKIGRDDIITVSADGMGKDKALAVIEKAVNVFYSQSSSAGGADDEIDES